MNGVIRKAEEEPDESYNNKLYHINRDNISDIHFLPNISYIMTNFDKICEKFIVKMSQDMTNLYIAMKILDRNMLLSYIYIPVSKISSLMVNDY